MVIKLQRGGGGMIGAWVDALCTIDLMYHSDNCKGRALQQRLLISLWRPKWEKKSKKDGICRRLSDSLCYTAGTGTCSWLSSVYRQFIFFKMYAFNAENGTQTGHHPRAEYKILYSRLIPIMDHPSMAWLGRTRVTAAKRWRNEAVP